MSGKNRRPLPPPRTAGPGKKPVLLKKPLPPPPLPPPQADVAPVAPPQAGVPPVAPPEAALPVSPARGESDARGRGTPRSRRSRRQKAEAPVLAVSAVETGALPHEEDGHARHKGAPGSGRDVGEQIRALEERLDQMIDQASRRERYPNTPPSHARLPSSSASRAPDEADTTVFDTARELLSTDFYLRKWGRLGMRNRSEEVDDFGFDPVYEHKVLPFFNFLYDTYFRVSTEGIEKIPGEGRCLLVSNHSGTFPFDGMMIKTAVKREHGKHRDVRWLAEDFIFHFPFVGSFTNRIGAVRACQENAERLLRHEALVAVFPEGVKGIGKLYRDRYHLQRFGRGGFVKLCLRTNTPIVPVAVLGAEETNPMLARLHVLSKALGLPYIPVTPTFPLLGPLGFIPAPTKWKILFGDAIAFDGYAPEAAEDEILVGRFSEQVRASIQTMLDRALAQRKSVWFG
jgi:1-acyl-sn-glycerol-3-phosphate acyltransferase